MGGLIDLSGRLDWVDLIVTIVWLPWSGLLAWFNLLFDLVHSMRLALLGLQPWVDWVWLDCIGWLGWIGLHWLWLITLDCL